MMGELSAAEIEELLRSEWVARLGCHANDTTYVVPVSYAYDGEALYGHTGDGLKLRLLRSDPRVCVEVDRVHGIANWSSVIAWGHFEELHGDEAMDAMRLLIQRFTTMISGEDTVPTHGMRVLEDPTTAHFHDAAVFRIRLDEKSGRFERR
jgi:nitroimidazol reductase NimA-like FMN-containing flavoprotein (pyridoxamine 5'-phosphate oxidase superfamily)